ncbi:hypothetical protein OSB04_020707 [Centaurea solstitialis]|uniref:Phorbol-ester/DAG-type domain-containing protein n=1 Tax=Centaurea solstitialis TaxID=347529 RepID=A0AA38WFI5_9ASTR|nr:hypothetical protein OSB04_020707 [Centaurea solstitialis]
MGDYNKMEFKEVDLEEIKHEHPLILIDLQLLHQDYVEDDEDVEDDDLNAFQNFKCECAICGFGIDWYHRCYYKCKEHLSCNYSVHKFCADEIATTLRFPAHPNHILNLKKAITSGGEWKCHSCLEIHQLGMFCYVCSTCDYVIDLHCATFMEQNTIHHPGHPHPLTSISTIDPILSKCCVCGKKHEGMFYHCTTCINFSIHIDCVALPFKFLLQNDCFSHTHKLTVSYSGSIIPYGFKCRICRKEFSNELWLYKCSKCLYYVHVDCATLRGKSSMSILSSRIDKKFEVVGYSGILNFPLPDESYNILWHHISREKNVSLTCSIHEHPLVLVNTESTSRIFLLHDPMKRNKVLCNACVRPITRMPFYKCDKGRGCDFYLHEWCTRLPTELKNHPGHPQHTLVFFAKYRQFYATFRCDCCDLDCNGFGYVCSESQCDYRIDVNCGFIPEQITHESHAHSLSRFNASSSATRVECHACHGTTSDERNQIYFGCDDCDFYLDSQCALHLPQTIRHKYDKHPLKLSYIPIENHSTRYFCEVCEDFLNPNNWFYHCSKCSHSIHSACAPFILKSEQAGAGSVEDLGGVCHVININFWGVIEVTGHNHPLSFVMGTKSDGDCNVCSTTLESFFIFKCLQTQCKFALHSSSCHSPPPRDLVFRQLAPRHQLTSRHRLTPRHRLNPRHDSLNLRPLELRKQETPLQTPIAFYPSGLMRPGN